MHMETRRLILRDFRKEDLCDLHAILGDAETMHYMEPPYTPEQTREFLMDFCIGRRGALAAQHRESGHVIGYVLFKPYGEPDVREIAWVFHRDCWRQGYAYECCSALIRHAFTHMGVHKIFAEAIDGVRSVGLMKKLGMRLEGVQRKQTRDVDGSWADLYFYGLLREEYPLCDAGTPEEIDEWMDLMLSLRDHFPGLEEAEHRDTVLRFMAEGRALRVRIGAKLAGVLLFSRTHSMICCLAVAPEFRRMGVASLLMKEALAQMDRTRTITLSTFREGDPLGDAPRALYARFGFVPGALAEDFCYPTQIFTLPALHCHTD